MSKSKVVSIDGKEFDTSNTEISVAGLLRDVAEKHTSDVNAGVVILADTHGKVSNKIFWVGMSPLEVAGTMGMSQHLILKGSVEQ